MDKNTIVQLVIGLIVTAIVGAISYMFTSISDLKHNQDTMGVEVRQGKGERSDLWDKHNARIEQDERALTMFYEFQLKQERDNSDRISDLKDFEIEYYKNELAKFNQ